MNQTLKSCLYIVTLLAVMLCSFECFAQEASGRSNGNLTKVRFMPNWMPQAQFAGYFAAKELGYFEDEGLDVEFNFISQTSTKNPIDMLEQGEVDIITNLFVSAMVAATRGCDIVNILQTSQKSALMVVSRDSLNSLEQLSEMNVGCWRAGYYEIIDLITLGEGIFINWIPFITGINLYVFGAVDAILCYSYSEYIQLMLSVGKIPEERIIRMENTEYNFPEDGLYTSSTFLKEHPEVAEAFVKASVRGWLWVANNRDKALDIVMDVLEKSNVQNSNRYFQGQMLDEVLRLQYDNQGRRSFQPISVYDYSKIIMEFRRNELIDRYIEFSKMIWCPYRKELAKGFGYE